MTAARPALVRAALLAAALVLTGCGAQDPPAAPAEAAGAPGPEALAAAEEPVTVTIWHGLGGAGGEALQAQVDAFNAENDEAITAEAVFQGSYADALAKYAAAVRDQSTPSIMVSNDITTGYLHDAGQTVPAQALAEANPDDLDLEQLRPAASGYYTADGQLLAVPLATSMPLLYVDTALLEQAGVDTATLGTLEGVDAAARAVHGRLGVAGIVQPFDGWWFEQLSAGAGEPYCTPGNGRGGERATALSLTGEAQQEAIATLAALYTDGVALDTGTDGNDALAAFADGQVAMMLNSSGAIGGLRAAGAEGWTALPYPLSGPEDTSGALIGGAAMWVDGPGHSEAEQVASWKVVSHLASAPVQEAFSQATGYAPVNTAVDDSPTQRAFLEANPDYAVLAEQFAGTPSSPATAGCLSGAMTGVRTAVVAQMQAAFSGSTELDAALARAEEEGTTAIAEYLEQAGS